MQGLLEDGEFELRLLSDTWLSNGVAGRMMAVSPSFANQVAQNETQKYSEGVWCSSIALLVQVYVAVR